MKISESKIKAGFVDAVKKRMPSAVVFKHSDIQAGVPDLTVTWNKRTAWIEIKVARPTFTCRDLQLKIMSRLATQGLATFLIYDEREMRASFVTPEAVKLGAWSDPSRADSYATFKEIHEVMAKRLAEIMGVGL